METTSMRCGFCDHEHAAQAERCEECGAVLRTQPPGLVSAPSAAESTGLTLDSAQLAQLQTLIEEQGTKAAVAWLQGSTGLDASTAEIVLESMLRSGLGRGMSGVMPIDVMGAGSSGSPPSMMNISSSSISLDSQLSQELTAMLAAGQKIGAIRRLREAQGLGLAEAKRVVEALEALAVAGGKLKRSQRGCVVSSSAFLLMTAGLVTASLVASACIALAR